MTTKQAFPDEEFEATVNPLILGLAWMLAGKVIEKARQAARQR